MQQVFLFFGGFFCQEGGKKWFSLGSKEIKVIKRTSCGLLCDSSSSFRCVKAFNALLCGDDDDDGDPGINPFMQP